ncbi:MAG: phosphoadenosine phosphosulfate reductase family protein [Gammaproteobacteria bacterium]|nr:phosphoadenosine phosphosulfate reductase family protein [Gammaproteobacteria bacterium]NND40116.1 phosphoadenosine phosphosulfate reductase family protein [Pseudomonadales bacterium]MBT8150735.1 phosphoadenosine phosphosulfate reductase family protein [Gammaproteobacteria bacterium]NNL10288.1 phosphoadenosine phosphosulfate reductase family protein [Pseudomonadales bacterium]NNM10683.1 phosphoadenosine phosphosulfate reductase family protein [Pseudomonadales bacterium]
MELDLPAINAQLKDANASEIIRWALSLRVATISTTSFGVNAAVMLHLAQQVEPGLPVVWVDTGYNLRETYVIAQRLIDSLDLNMQVFIPEITAERRNAIMGGIPTIEEAEAHAEFTRQVKLEPFDRALRSLQPQIWLTGIRQHETEHRKTLDIVSVDARGIIKVAPIFYWSDEQVDDYMQRYDLPSCRKYFDPTKVQDGRECGLHTSA